MAYERLLGRGRSEEIGVMNTFLAAVHEKHDNWIKKDNAFGVPTFIINGNQTQEEIEVVCNAMKSQFLEVSKSP